MVWPPLNPVVVILGPTGSGKTATAHSIAQMLGRPVGLVGLDAFQIYRGLGIGTAAPTPEEQAHYHYACTAFLDPPESTDAAKFARLAHDACDHHASQGRTAVCVGGSGLYLRAFLHGLDAAPPRDDALRASLRERAERHGWPALHRELQSLDPARAGEIAPRDGVRIERALEIAIGAGSGLLASSARKAPLGSQPFLRPVVLVHVDQPREELHRRIARRVQACMEAGWRAEVERLLDEYGPVCLNFPALRAIGYQSIARSLLSGTFSCDEQSELIARKTRQYARQQETWNRKEACHLRHSGDLGKTLDDLRALLASSPRGTLCGTLGKASSPHLPPGGPPCA